MKNSEKIIKKGRKKNRGKAAMRFLKFLIPAVILVTGLAISPSLAFAQTGGADDSGSSVIINGDWNFRHPVKLKGEGTLKAEGNGAVRLKGRTDKTEGGAVNVSGNGVLVINDFEGDLDLTISGYGGKVELKKDVWLYYGFGGSAEIKGSGFAVNIMGNNLEIFAKGRAIVFLAGEGSYEVERGADSK